MLKFFKDKRDHPLGEVFNRYYFLQIGFIALAVIIGIACSAWVIKGSLLKTALEQEMSHYWQRLERNPSAALPDTKNLYGYRWRDVVPKAFQHLHLKPGVHRYFIDGKQRMAVYGEKNGLHVLLVFGESNVNKLIWLFGLAPLMVSLVVLYSVLWWWNRRARRHFSPITRLANALAYIDWQHQNNQASPFQSICTESNIEAEYLKQALEKYHQVLSEFIQREREFTGDVSHELRTPLTILKGNIQLCQARYGENKIFTRLHNTIEDMQLLVDTLLAIARNTTNTLNAEHMLLSTVLQALIDDLSAVSGHKGIQIHLQHDLNERPRDIYVSMAKMVFSNILRNALNYSQGTRIDIIVQKNQVLIADNGIGVTLPNNVKVQQLSDHPLQLEIKGYGIGLQLVEKLCRQLGWRIELFDRQYYLNIHQDTKLALSTGLIVLVYLC
ncbi:MULTISPECIES: HAMP domain-containing sensor histidine kinase [unclassified Acinetobacter]|uniref:sensor histidine kinase n=1 Tax=unclassified Acinetobacter TaxID=196816 RepID=UPI0029340F8F|nr:MULTISPECIES: HAMP domain-containing sensor histidine kinase [unclassified Acinetobacter]WOE32429.1 HAMP domain-containing sensor histidine kinase [Acinetobacter sp. SAAs470]WOE37903.1 HAMP domain-containing sensor histidine kinase [Acinetobacter sp. SAAs474]